MTERERQQQAEIEHLQKKVQSLTDAYSRSVQELCQLKEQKTKRQRGRPGVDAAVRTRILSLYQQGKTMRQVACETRTAVGTVHKVIAKAAEKSRRVYIYMDRQSPATIIDACPVTRRISIVNLTDNLLSRAFGIKAKPSWEDYEEFLECRCMPRTRYGVREELRYMGIDVYDPLLIIEKTDGRVYEDSQWLRRLEADEICRYDQIIKESKDPQEWEKRFLAFLSEGR